MADKIGVLITDDHPVVRQGLRVLLELEEDIEVVGEAEDGAEAAQKVKELTPDVVLMDLVMPELDGIAATKRIRELSPKTRVLVLTNYAEDEQVFGAMKAGATGYLLKDIEPRDLIQAIRSAHRGEPTLSSLVIEKLMGEITQPRTKQSTPLTELTPKEGEVLRLVARGKSNKDIANSLFISQKTVKTHMGNILGKLHLSNRTEATLYALRQGLVQPEQRP
jgi:NarL family two-component system response regulator LiaR